MSYLSEVIIKHARNDAAFAKKARRTSPLGDTLERNGYVIEWGRVCVRGFITKGASWLKYSDRVRSTGARTERKVERRMIAPTCFTRWRAGLVAPLKNDGELAVTIDELSMVAKHASRVA